MHAKRTRCYGALVRAVLKAGKKGRLFVSWVSGTKQGVYMGSCWFDFHLAFTAEFGTIPNKARGPVRAPMFELFHVRFRTSNSRQSASVYQPAKTLRP